MPRADLRELLQNVAWNDKAISQSLYALVEALVKKGEPKNAPADAPDLRELYQHTEKYHSYNPALYTLLGALVKAVGPEDADATIRKLREERDVLVDSLKDLLLVKAKAEIERLRPLAENWQLVLGMQQGSRLDKGNSFYMSVDCGPPLIYASTLTTDPAEALSAIQKTNESILDRNADPEYNEDVDD